MHEQLKLLNVEVVSCLPATERRQKAVIRDRGRVTPSKPKEEEEAMEGAGRQGAAFTKARSKGRQQRHKKAKYRGSGGIKLRYGVDPPLPLEESA